jgi:SAM-dependent methyltransferase
MKQAPRDSNLVIWLLGRFDVRAMLAGYARDRDTRRQLVSLAVACALGCFVLVPVSVAAVSTAKDQIWERFLQWLSTNPPVDRPTPIYEQYRAHLLAGGASPAEANQHLSVIRQMLRTRNPEGWRTLFNRIYSSPTPGFNTNPNALLVTAVDGRIPGRALDVGMGQGRNAVFLAMKGWDVTGFDVSDEGLRIAQRNAERAGVKLNAVLQSDDHFDFGTERWDLIVIAYTPVPLTIATYVEKLHRSLRRGGLVVVESFASASGSFDRRPVDIDPDQLRRAFEGFRIIRFEDTFATPDWGQATSRLARLIAEKP